MLLLKILILALLRCWKALRRRSHLNETDKFQFSLLAAYTCKAEAHSRNSHLPYLRGKKWLQKKYVQEDTE